MLVPQDSREGTTTSPGGFEFGVQGWIWGEPRPNAITFFLDGTAMVADQHGRAIKGAAVEHGGRVEEVWFATRPPQYDDPMPGYVIHGRVKVKLATHAQVIAALIAERVDWARLSWVGWPQIPYEELKKLPRLPPWPFNAEHVPAASSATNMPCTCVTCAIRDPKLRKDALRLKREWEDARIVEATSAAQEG